MKTTDVLGCVGWAVFLLLSPAFIPLIGPFFCLLTPLPFLYYSTKLGLQDGVKLMIPVILVIGLISQLTGYQNIVFKCIELGLMGLVLSELFRRKYSISQTIFFASGFMVLMNLCFIFWISLSSNLGPFEMILATFHEYLKDAIDLYKKAGVPEEQINEFEKYGKALIDTVCFSFILVSIGLFVWLNVILSRLLFRMRNLEYPDFVPLDRWKVPENMVWGAITCGFASFFLTGIIQLVADNMLIVLMFIYFFHGISIILFFLNKYKLPSWIRIGVYFLLIIQPPFQILLAFAGILDQWVDFRKLNHESETR